MTLPSTVTTNLWPDYKNTPFGPFPRIDQISQPLNSATAEIIGTALSEKVAQSFLAISGELFSIDLMMSKNSSPTDSLNFELCADNGNAPGAVIATGTSLPNDRLSNVNVFRRTIFTQPVTLTVGTRYWIVVSRSGALNGTHNYNLRTSTANPYADGKLMKYASGAWSDVTNNDATFKANFRVSGRYQPSIDKTNNKVRMFKSTDNGGSWSEQDSANAPAIISTANFKSVSAYAVDELIYVYTITSTLRFDIQKFDTATDAWTTQEDGDTSTTINTNVSGTAPLMGHFRPTAGPTSRPPNVVVYNGATETVMGNARNRIKLSRGPTYQTTEFDVVGSANTPDTTLPGTAVNHDLRITLEDADDVVHIFWTQSDDSNVHHRQWNNNDTFSTTNLLGSTPATTSNSAAYPIGLPCNFYRDNTWNVGLPVVASDGSSITVLQATIGNLSTQASWGSATAVSQSVEVSTSNPCVLVPDNEQGGRLYLFFVGADDKLYFTHDGGNDAWRPPEEFRPGVSKTLTALSAGVGIDDVGMVWFDTVPATDAILFDRLDVYFEKGDYGTGTHESIRDFGAAAQVSYMMVIDVDELAATSYLANFYTRETETDSWGLMSTISAEEADTNAYVAFTRSRYVKVEITITGGTFPSGVFGYES